MHRVPPAPCRPHRHLNTAGDSCRRRVRSRRTCLFIDQPGWTAVHTPCRSVQVHVHVPASRSRADACHTCAKVSELCTGHLGSLGGLGGWRHLASSSIPRRRGTSDGLYGHVKHSTRADAGVDLGARPQVLPGGHPPVLPGGHAGTLCGWRGGTAASGRGRDSSGSCGSGSSGSHGGGSRDGSAGRRCMTVGDAAVDLLHNWQNTVGYACGQSSTPAYLASVAVYVYGRDGGR